MLVDKDRAPADSSRINLGEEWEIQWWCTKFGCTEIALRRAVDIAGPSAADIEREIKKAGKEAMKNTGED